MERHLDTHLELYILSHSSEWRTWPPYQTWMGLVTKRPLPPIILILVMDPRQRLLDMATHAGLLHPIGADLIKLRTSLFVDDATVFIRPIPDDVENLQ